MLTTKHLFLDQASVEDELGQGKFENGKISKEQIQKMREVLKKKLNHNASFGWPDTRIVVGFQQLMLGPDAWPTDGYKGPQTLYALELWQNKKRNQKASYATKNRVWPNQRDVQEFYGTAGQNLVSYRPPYEFYLYDTNRPVSVITLHKKVVASVEEVLQDVRRNYTPKQIHELHLNRFFGSFMIRKMRGGKEMSMHSWGIALDFDASRNQFRWTSEQAAFAKPVYEAWWQCWESQGWVSLGRQRNFDWMHVQAAEL